MKETYDMQAARDAVASFNQAAVDAFDRQIAAARVIVTELDAFKAFYGKPQGTAAAFAECVGFSQGHLSKVVRIGRATDAQVKAYRRDLQDPTVWDFYTTVLSGNGASKSPRSFDATAAAKRIGAKLTPAQRQALAAALLSL